MRKFLIILAIIVIFTIIFLISLYIPSTFNKKNLTLQERFNCIFYTSRVKDEQIVQFLKLRKEGYEQQTIEEQQNVVEQNKTNLKLLDADAHQYAFKEWCTRNGHRLDVNADTGLFECSYTQDSCVKSNNIIYKYYPETEKDQVDASNSVYYEWHNNKCIKTYPFAISYCHKTNYDSNFPYYQGNIVCDSDTNKCTVKENPTCYIPKDYCFEKGLEYDDSGFGDCFNPFIQEIFEIIFGTTITRETKKAIYDIMDKCQSGPITTDCMEKLYDFSALPRTIIKDTTIKFIQDRWKESQKACSGIESADDFGDCWFSIRKFDPTVWAGDLLSKLIDSLICKIPGVEDALGCEWGQKIYKALFTWPFKVIEYLIKYGPVIGKAIVESLSQLGDILVQGYAEVGEKLLVIFDKLAELTTSIFIDYNPVYLCSKALIYGGVELYEKFQDFFDNDRISDIIIYSTVISTAFESGGEELGKFVTETVILGGLSALENTGEVLVTAFGGAAEEVLVSATEVGNGLIRAGEELANAGSEGAETLKDAGEQVGQVVQDTANSVADAVEDAADAVGSFIMNPVSGCVVM
jgi:hypothetical protein